MNFFVLFSAKHASRFYLTNSTFSTFYPSPLPIYPSHRTLLLLFQYAPPHSYLLFALFMYQWISIFIIFFFFLFRLFAHLFAQLYSQFHSEKITFLFPHLFAQLKFHKHLEIMFRLGMHFKLRYLGKLTMVQLCFGLH